MNYWWNCTEGVWWPCYIGSDIWFQTNLWEQLLLRDLVSWGNPGECSMIDHFLRDASEVLSCPFWSTVLQCGARLPIHTLNYYTVHSVVVPGSYLGVCLSVTLLIVDLLQFFVFCRRSGVTRCTRLMMRYQDRICASAGNTRVPWSLIGTLMRHLAAEPRRPHDVCFPLNVPLEGSCWPRVLWCGQWALRVLRAGIMLFYWPKLLYPYYSLLRFFFFSSSCL